MDDEWSPEDGVIEQLCGSWRGCGEGKSVPVSWMDRFSSLKHVDDVTVWPTNQQEAGEAI